MMVRLDPSLLVLLLLRVPDVIVAMVTRTAMMPRRRDVAVAGVRSDVGRRQTGSGILLGVLVGLDVLAEVVGAHEALVADAADEPLLAGVSSDVPLQLVGTREPLAAEQPVAQERTLARVPAQVRLHRHTHTRDHVTTGTPPSTAVHAVAETCERTDKEINKQTDGQRNKQTRRNTAQQVTGLNRRILQPKAGLAAKQKL